MADGSIILDIEARDTGLVKTLEQARTKAMAAAGNLSGLCRSITLAGSVSAATKQAMHSLLTQMILTGNGAGNLATGLRAGFSAAAAASQAGSAAVLSPWKSAVSTAGSLGRSLSSAMAQGISGGSGLISAAASQSVRGVSGAVWSVSWPSLGYHISSGIAQGIYGGSSQITAAAKSAALNALSAAKKTLGVHSPSRVFREEVGRMIPLGMAEGISDGAGELNRAMTLSAARLQTITGQALRPSPSMPLMPRAAGTVPVTAAAPMAPVVVETPLYLDGREIARASARYTGRQMAFLEGL